MQQGRAIILDTFPVTWTGHSIRPAAIQWDYKRTSLIFLMPTVTLLSADDPASVPAATYRHPFVPHKKYGPLAIPTEVKMR